MANPTVLDWLYENELRAYPLKDRIDRSASGYELVDGVILDAQLVFNEVYNDEPLLTSIVANSSTVTFTVNGDIDFVVNKSDPFPQYVRLPSNHLMVFGEKTLDIPTGTFTFNDVGFEPSVVFELADAWKGVDSISFEGPALTGEIHFIEGYQFNLNFNIDPQVIQFGAGNLYGLPIGCTHFGFEDNDCDSIIAHINGVTPDGVGELRIEAGEGVSVWDDPENHRIYIGFSFTSIDDICKTVPGKPLT